MKALSPDQKVVNEDRLIGRNGLERLYIPLQPSSFVSADMDDFNSNPVILNLPDLGQADLNARTPIVQPQTNLDKVTGNQLIRGSHL